MNVSQQTILIAGGTGLIGQYLKRTLEQKKVSVRILTRNPWKKNEYYWDPLKKELDKTAFENVTVLINLSGAGIADDRWTSKRKKELEDSRVQANTFLFSQISNMTALKHFISASGINAYTPNQEMELTEDSPYGQDFLSSLTRKWEESASLFSSHVKVSIIRTAVVLSSKGGAYTKLASLTKFGLGSGLGTGKQPIPWIHISDLTNIYVHMIEKEISGTFNAVAKCTPNKEFMRELAFTLKKPFFLPNVPGWAMKLLLGEMSTMLLDGVRASNQKLRNTGFSFVYDELQTALEQLNKESE